MAARTPDRQIAKLNIAALARQYGSEAVEKLAEAMRSDDIRVAVDAATRLLDRGFGKPSQTITHEDRPVESMTDAELLAEIRKSSLAGDAAQAKGTKLTH